MDEVGELPPTIQVKLLGAADGGGYSQMESQIEQYVAFKEIGALKPHRPAKDLELSTWPNFSGHQGRVHAFFENQSQNPPQKDAVL